MYLKEIRAQGFKSFADKTIIELSPGITGVVGPNGSGKSNVVDAIRWVLGEQSVKELRGDSSMTDVIFNGTTARNPLNVASVALTFDNTDHYLPVDFDEVCIKRRIYKDGTNEYFLNEEQVRYKDIQNLLMDSGMGKDSLNIISQGKIDAILSNKPVDRRAVFEDAAGVLKYKKRKEEALKKLSNTHDNMDRVNDIINELENQVEPLKKQRDNTLKYNDFNEQLQNIEIALITNDITKINYDYQDKLGKIDALKEEILKLNTSNSNNEAVIEKYKLDISKIESQIKETNDQLLKITSEVEQINSRKAIILERQKYKVDDAKLHQNIINLKEQALNLDKNIKTSSLELQDLIAKLSTIKIKYNDQSNLTNKLKLEQNSLETKLSNYVKDENVLRSSINNLKEAIDNNSVVPYSVKMILDNPTLNGVHDVIGSLIDVDTKYSVAISTALGAASSFVVVDNENVAKQCINFLKTNNYGRATFFPMNIIKPKSIDSEISDSLKNMQGYVGIASSLVNFDPRYRSIILNQLGNIIVVENIDIANVLAHKINYRYRIVTLDGELLNVGGSLTGGKSKVRNIISDKYELELKINDYEKVNNNIKDIESKINDISESIRNSEDKVYLIDKERIEVETYINNKNSTIKDLNNSLNSINEEINGTNNILNNTLTEEENNIINEYYAALTKKENIKHKYDELNRDKNTLSDTLSNFEFSLKKENSLFSSKSDELHNLEIETNRMDVKLDTLLNTLNDTYNMTYEKASSLYRLELEENVARNKVNNLKKSIRDLGPINPEAPNEYEKVSTRYEFLIKQHDDLVNAENILLEIIKEMDQVMIKEFMKTFNVIKEEFSKTFKELFRGGHASLSLTDKDNILETGIEIEACPPGKTPKSINALSGGERTFTAISLLFAILKSRTVPFCILDEVEAALDEANVDSFGEYVTKLRDKTQFVLITHKKKTMEYADVLYGITMQESGVSKLVSVRLEELKKEG